MKSSALFAALGLLVSSNAVAQTAPSAPFGHHGQWLLMGSSNAFAISNETFSNSAARFFNVGTELGLDHFVADNFSVGLDAEASYADTKGYGATALYETKSSHIAGGVRFGFNVPLGESWSWYPRLTLLLDSEHSKIKSLLSFGDAPLPPRSTEARFGPAMNLYAPLLLQAAPHFVVGFGPRFQHEFGFIRGGPRDGSQSTLLGGQFVIGGWWGGAAPNTLDRQAPTPDGEKTAEPRFAEEGELVLTIETDASGWYRSYSHAKGYSSTVAIQPSVDYFVAQAVSVGIDAFISHSSGTSLDSLATETRFSSTLIGAAPRLGANLALSSFVSIWLRGEIGSGTVTESRTSDDGSNQHSRRRTWLSFSAPVLVHPSSHFFVGAGPFLFHELSDGDQQSVENTATSVGMNLMLGGWFAAGRWPKRADGAPR